MKFYGHVSNTGILFSSFLPYHIPNAAIKYWKLRNREQNFTVVQSLHTPSLESQEPSSGKQQGGWRKKNVFSSYEVVSGWTIILKRIDVRGEAYRFMQNNYGHLRKIIRSFRSIYIVGACRKSYGVGQGATVSSKIKHWQGKKIDLWSSNLVIWWTISTICKLPAATKCLW